MVQGAEFDSTLLIPLAGRKPSTSIAAAAHVVHALTQPLSDTGRVAAQVRWLNAARADGAAQRMQELFPEGEFFTHLLTGLAAASTGDIDTVRSALAASGTPAVRDRFGDIDELAGGTFYRGWRLLLWAEQVRLSGADGAALLAEADAVQAALLANPRGVPASYPGGYWPCDAVVAMAPAHAHENIATLVAPHLTRDQAFLAAPGQTLTLMPRTLLRHGHTNPVTCVTSTLPYICRKTGEGRGKGPCQNKDPREGSGKSGG